MQLRKEYSWCLEDRGMFVVIYINNISFCGKVCRCRYETLGKRKGIKMMFNREYYLKSPVLIWFGGSFS
jgi:hypothetical protein